MDVICPDEMKPPVNAGIINVGQQMKTFTAYVEQDPETGLYVGIVPGVTGAHSQARTLDELRDNLKEVLELCLDESGETAGNVQSKFIGLQQIEVGV